MRRAALATCAAVPAGPDDERGLAPALARHGLAAEWVAWDGPGVDWHAYDRVLVRSAWDYVDRRDAFLAWAETVGPGRLANPPAVIAWSSDKAYLSELEAAGLPVVETIVLVPGDAVPALGAGEWVVKPAISAGARDTGRWDAPGARAHAARLLAAGRSVLVQPYLIGVEEGEAALVWIAGELSHAMRKRAFLEPGSEAPVREDGTGLTAAEAMYAEDLMTPLRPAPAQVELGARVVDWLRARFGAAPAYARIDMLAGPDGAPRVLEAELVEPALWLDRAPGAAERLAAALAQ